MAKFKKKERLTDPRIFTKLIKCGDSLYKHPLKIFFINKQTSNEHSPLVEIAFSVPKKRIKKAVKRNLIKRRLREAYRENKNDLYQKLQDKKIIILLIYNKNTIEDYKTIEQSLQLLLHQLSNKLKIEQK